MKKNSVIFSKFLLPLFLILSPCFHVQALTIVRMEMQLATTIANVDMELYDEDAPLTVSNFLGYVNRGDYDNIIFNRSVTDFVVQGGAYSYVPKIDFDARYEAVGGSTNLTVVGDPLTGELGLRPIGETYFVDANNDDIEDTDSSGERITRVNDGLQNIPIDTTTLPVLNEPGISNLRGTLAMAKLPDDPDSASREWFVNLTDNSQNLDYQNGGFTVFGSIMGSGIDYFDAVSAQTLHTFGILIGPGFSSLPVINADGTLHSGYGAIFNENVARVNSANEILHIDLSGINFDEVTIGVETQRTIVVTNKWSAPITINKFGDQAVLSAPYSVITDNCSGTTIQPTSTCDIVLGLNLSSTGVFLANTDFSFVNPDISRISIDLSGYSSTGVDPDINVEQVVDFGDALLDSDVLTKSLTVANSGQGLLTISSITPPSGVDSSNFLMTHDCISLSLGSSCTVTLKFDLGAGDLGDKISEIIINSDDPDAPAIVVSLLGSVSSENDGISDNEENSGLNAGDGNNDGIQDSIQSNVTSLQVASGDYITVTAGAVYDGFHNLSNVREIANPSPSDMPNISFNYGFISYDIKAFSTLVNDLSSFDVAIVLPIGSDVNTYYQYGATNDNNVPHWYEFMFDGTVGAQIFKNQTLTSNFDGTQIQRDIIFVRYKDGDLGDHDLTVNGSVSVVAAVGRKNTSSDGGGQISAWIMFLVLLSIRGFRLRVRN